MISVVARYKVEAGWGDKPMIHVVAHTVASRRKQTTGQEDSDFVLSRSVSVTEKAGDRNIWSVIGEWTGVTEAQEVKEPETYTV